MKIITAIMAVLMVPGLVFAAMPVNPSYVSSTGSGTACTEAAPCALSYANSNAAAGDVINIRGGTYNFSGALTKAISPTNSGSAGNVITFQNYTGESPAFVNTDGVAVDVWAVNLAGKDYIKITGISFQDFYRWAYLTNGADYNEISYCTFFNSSDVTSIGIYIANGGYANHSTHNWIHHNTLYRSGTAGCAEGGGHIQVGSNTSGDNGSNNNTIEYNTIYHAGHALTDDFAYYNVWRGNVGWNNGWKANPTGCTYDPDPADSYPGDNKYGHRGFSIYAAADDQETNKYRLWEGNRSGYASINPNNNGSENLVVSGKGSIIRYNAFFGADGPGIYFKNGVMSSNNRTYNNTIYGNGRYSGSTVGVIKTGIEVTKDSVDNVFTNNLLYDTGTADVTCQGTGCDMADSTWSNNWCSTVGCGGIGSSDPSFINPSLDDYTNVATLPNLIPAAAGVIDQGTYLTTVHADDTGSGTTLILTDALYFQAGSAASTTPMGSALSSVAGDVILVGATVGAAAEGTITDINYATNTITLSAGISRSDGDKVWLKKKSDGVIVLNGAGPDIGAYETGSSAYTVTPATTTGCTVSPSGAVSVNSGSTTTITMTAAYGYSISGSGCSGSLSGSTFTTGSISADCTVTCTGLGKRGVLGGTGAVSLGGSGTATLGN